MDLAYVSAAGLKVSLATGTWSDRLKRAAILRDKDGYVEGLRTRVLATQITSEALARRFGYGRERGEAERAAMRRAVEAGDAPLAVLDSRLAVQSAAGSLLDLNDDRVSVTHFVDSVERALRQFGQSDLFEPCLRALCLREVQEDVDRAVGAFHTFAGVLREWLEDANPLGAPFRLRVAEYRAFYRVDEARRVVYVLRVGYKPGETLSLRGQPICMRD